MARVTLKDVAARAGVSYQTVSKVLNKQATVTPETEERIWEAIRTLGYRPNVSARNLRTQSSNLIGYGWQEMHNNNPRPVLDRFLYSAVQQAEANSYRMLAFLTPSDPEETTKIYRDMYGRRQVEGFILADTNDNDPRIQFLIEQEIPFASFGRANDEWDFCWVDVNGRSGLEQVTRHLQEQNHERIAFISWPEGSRAGTERETGYLNQIKSREAGYREGMEQAGFPLNQDWIVRGENSVPDGYKLAQQLLCLPPAERPTAIACISDLMAIGAMNAAMTLGLEVGRDVAITGYDNLPMTEFLYPPLTTVQQPIQEAGELVIKLLLSQINREALPEKNILLDPKLIIRQSS